MFKGIVPIAVFLISSSSGFACPVNLTRLKTDYLPAGKTLCGIYDDYHSVVNQLISEFKTSQPENPPEPWRIANVIAPRFIDGPDWAKANSKGIFDPWQVYGNKTWRMWQNGADRVNQLVALNIKSGSIAPLSAAWVEQLHALTLKNLLDPGSLGVLRNYQKYGRALKKEIALPCGTASVLNHLEYRSIRNPSQPLASWEAKKCYEDLDSAFQDQHQTDKVNDLFMWPRESEQTCFEGEDRMNHLAVQKQCGILTYGDYHEIKQQLDLWATDINAKISTWNSPRPKGDVLLTAARTQRWLISIHPFQDGNGRMSRFAMEYILMSLGLPTVIVPEMDNDIVTSEKDWAFQYGLGMVETLNRLHSCAANLDAPGCNITGVSE